MKRFFDVRLLMVFGLVSIVISAQLVAIWIGFVPDRHGDQLQARATIAEVMAASAMTHLARGEPALIRQTMIFVVERNPSVRSAGLRRASGEVVAATADHATLWVPTPDNRSTETAVVVPLFGGGKAWGQLEILFQPIQAPGFLGDLLDERVRMVSTIALLCFGSFFLYLRRMLRHLDPSRAVPDRVRSALDTLAEGLLLLDTNGFIVLANQAFSTLVGEDADKLVGRAGKDFAWTTREGTPMPEEALPWSIAMRTGEPVRNLFCALPDANGHRRSFIANCSPVMGANDKPGGVLMSLEDVTELEEKEAQLRESKAQADDANRAKSEFLANMSHEIRTPMNAILGFTEVLRRGMGRADVDPRKHLDTIHRNGTHLLELINDILDLSKVESGRFEIERTECMPHLIAHDVIEVLGVKARERGIELRFEATSAVPGAILGDPARLRQIITNLVGNAIKFTERGGVYVSQRWVGDKRSGFMEIAIRDTGIGIPQDKCESIFEPFVQAEGSTTRKYGGTGLGLSISRKFARAMGGDIIVTSAPGKGSTFLVRIAADAMPGAAFMSPEEIAASHETRADEGVGSWKFERGRILVVDDSPENRELVKLVLEDAGIEVVEAENGQQAVDKATTMKFSLILMDMNMPVMDGFTATRVLRGKGLETPIIAFTAHALKGFESEIVAAGCTGYLTKPIVIEDMMTLLAQYLKGTRTALAPPPLAASFAAAASQPQDSAPPPRAASAPAQSGPTAARAASGPADRSPIVSRLAVNRRLHPTIAGFGRRLPQQLDEMRSALAAGDLASVAKVAHWLKGSAGSVGFDVFTEPAKRLEENAARGNADGARQALDEVRALSARIQIPEVTSTAVATSNAD